MNNFARDLLDYLRDTQSPAPLYKVTYDIDVEKLLKRITELEDEVRQLTYQNNNLASDLQYWQSLTIAKDE